MEASQGEYTRAGVKRPAVNVTLLDRHKNGKCARVERDIQGRLILSPLIAKVREVAGSPVAVLIRGSDLEGRTESNYHAVRLTSVL